MCVCVNATSCWLAVAGWLAGATVAEVLSSFRFQPITTVVRASLSPSHSLRFHFVLFLSLLSVSAAFGSFFFLPPFLLLFFSFYRRICCYLSWLLPPLCASLSSSVGLCSNFLFVVFILWSYDSLLCVLILLSFIDHLLQTVLLPSLGCECMRIFNACEGFFAWVRFVCVCVHESSILCPGLFFGDHLFLSASLRHSPPPPFFRFPFDGLAYPSIQQWSAAFAAANPPARTAAHSFVPSLTPVICAHITCLGRHRRRRY